MTVTYLQVHNATNGILFPTVDSPQGWVQTEAWKPLPQGSSDRVIPIEVIPGSSPAPYTLFYGSRESDGNGVLITITYEESAAQPYAYSVENRGLSGTLTQYETHGSPPIQVELVTIA